MTSLDTVCEAAFVVSWVSMIVGSDHYSAGVTALQPTGQQLWEACTQTQAQHTLDLNANMLTFTKCNANHV